MKNLNTFLPLLIMILPVVTVLPVQATLTVSISDLSVSPALAGAGTFVTASATVQNGDSNPVSLTVTFSDSGVNLATQQITVPAGGSASAQASFRTVTGAPHCYAATTSPVYATKGFCESGGSTGVLGGTSLATIGLSLLAPVAAIVAAGGITLALLARRSRKNN